MKHSFISVEEAHTLILKALPTIGTERVMLTQACSRVLAKNISSSTQAPSFDNSARDGFAISFDDVANTLPVHLQITQEIFAGMQDPRPISSKEAARITTGAMLPQGADTILMRELCTTQDNGRTLIVENLLGTTKGAWVRKKGSFVKKDTLMLHRGHRIRPGDIGVLASMNIVTLEVMQKPRVSIISTGDELVEIGQHTGPGQIINSNAFMLEALIKEFGAIPRVFPIAPDHKNVIEKTYQDAIASSDMVLSIGGVSMGERDYVREVLMEQAQGLEFWNIRMRPGKPLAFGIAQQTPLFGLPGNPASCFVCAHKFVRTALDHMCGMHLRPTFALKAKLSARVESTQARKHYVTGHLTRSKDHILEFVPIPQQDSGNPAILCHVEALGIIDEGISLLEHGDDITVELLI